MALGYFLVPMAGPGGPTLEMSVDFLHSPSLRQRKTHSGPVLFFSFFLSWFLYTRVICLHYVHAQMITE